MSIKLLTEHHLELLSLKGGCKLKARLSLLLSKCHIVGNRMSRLICTSVQSKYYLFQRPGHGITIPP